MPTVQHFAESQLAKRLVVLMCYLRLQVALASRMNDDVQAILTTMTRQSSALRQKLHNIERTADAAAAAHGAPVGRAASPGRRPARGPSSPAAEAAAMRRSLDSLHIARASAAAATAALRPRSPSVRFGDEQRRYADAVATVQRYTSPTNISSTAPSLAGTTQSSVDLATLTAQIRALAAAHAAPAASLPAGGSAALSDVNHMLQSFRQQASQLKGVLEGITGGQQRPRPATSATAGGSGSAAGSAVSGSAAMAQLQAALSASSRYTAAAANTRSPAPMGYRTGATTGRPASTGLPPAAPRSQLAAGPAGTAAGSSGLGSSHLLGGRSSDGGSLAALAGPGRRASESAAYRRSSGVGSALEVVPSAPPAFDLACTGGDGDHSPFGSREVQGRWSGHGNDSGRATPRAFLLEPCLDDVVYRSQQALADALAGAARPQAAAVPPPPSSTLTGSLGGAAGGSRSTSFSGFM